MPDQKLGVLGEVCTSSGRLDTASSLLVCGSSVDEGKLVGRQDANPGSR